MKHTFLCRGNNYESMHVTNLHPHIPSRSENRPIYGIDMRMNINEEWKGEDEKDTMKWELESPCGEFTIHLKSLTQAI